MEIAAVCPKAGKLGLHAGMPLAKARAMFRHLDIREAEHEADEAFLYRLGLFAARRLTPRVGLSAPNGLWLDLNGVSHLFNGERRMCERILAFCSQLGFFARIAVAGTTGAAHALARYSRDRIILCPSGHEAEAIAGFPPAALRLDEEAIAATRRFGIESIGNLIAMPRAPLRRRFGAVLLTRLDQALGWIEEPFEPVIPKSRPSILLRFVEPIVTPEAIEAAAAEAILRLCSLLEQEGLGARRLQLCCDRIDGNVQQIAIGTARATRDRSHLQRLLCGKIEEIEPGFGIEQMRLIAFSVEALAPQPVEGALNGRTDPDLAPFIDKLAVRIGQNRVYRLSAVESDVPERSVRRLSPLEEPHEWPPEWARPVRLLSPPEPIGNIIAMLPDQPPRRFTWRGKAHLICRADGPERIYGEWWNRISEVHAVRDYFQVEDETGARFWIYRRGDAVDPRTGDLSWHMHGLFA